MKPAYDTVRLLRSRPARTVKAYVVVVNPGMNDQREDSEFANREQANKYCASLCVENIEADVMKRLPDGTLTTEF
ncbi:hypothetical protein HUU62_04295 [Rhodoferax sp. 4810]|nr:hypothetical protein [Rhodoferax jenense]